MSTLFQVVMPPSVTAPHSVRSGSGKSETKKMTSGSFFKVRDREEPEIQDARQKASIKWLVTKAYGNNPPREFQEPYYRYGCSRRLFQGLWLVSCDRSSDPIGCFRNPNTPDCRDHNNKDKLKPHLVHALANAELYCMAMSFLYTDPNYNNLNHWGIIQVIWTKLNTNYKDIFRGEVDNTL